MRCGEHLALDMISVSIGPRFQGLALAASPADLDRPPPLHPLVLLTHDCIRLLFLSGTVWGAFVTVDPPGQIIIGVNAAPAAIELASAGHGILCTFENWLEPALKAGNLHPVLPEWWSRFDGPILYFSSRLMSAPLRAFVDLVAEERRAKRTPT
ncbi:LysR substrate-binding domain-containing protein [Agrobacterium rubi]|uniref:LysR substrate-binding domain-containing protein n=1 Tax=Agrobacterium rubi TaxID=28099 RepID=UPI00307ED115